MKNKIIVVIAIISILILISGISAYLILSENMDNSIKTANNTTKNITNTSTNQINLTNETKDLTETLEIKDDPNFPTTKKIGKEDAIYIFYNSGYNGQSDIHRGLIIYISNSSNELEGYTLFKITQVLVKFQDDNGNTVYKTYTPQDGEYIKEKVPKNLTPLSATIYYQIR
jgi:hypothetical protein